MQRRQLSSSPLLKTRQRQDMFRWLNGPGSAFRQPLPNSTNYLSAYDKTGGLIRADGATRPQISDRNESKESADGDKRLPEGGGMPQETAEDLMPFPMNKHFRSQPVLSDELKDEIYRRITEDGQDVRTVSASLGVEMRRVAAVVRLKAVENQWVKEVSHIPTTYIFCGTRPCHDETTDID